MSNRSNRLLLHDAAADGHCDEIRRLHAQGGDVNAKDAEFGSTPVYNAAKNGHADCIRVLHGLGADLNLCSIGDYSPLNLCRDDGIPPISATAAYGHVECIRVLHELGADVNLCAIAGYSPVYVAAELGHVGSIRVLYELGADVNLYDTDGWPPVNIAAERGQVESIRELHGLGANLNLCDNFVSSPVYFAALEGHVSRVTMLVHLDADVKELLLEYVDVEGTHAVIHTVNNIRTFLAATKLNTSKHQFTLYSVAQLAAYYMQRRQYPEQQPEDVRNFALRLASEVQDSLIVAPFIAAAARVSTKPARRLLVLLAARTAVDGAVKPARRNPSTPRWWWR
jgi:ankyrin repeat protein